MRVEHKLEEGKLKHLILEEKTQKNKTAKTDVLKNWILGSPYALPDDAPEEVKEWGKKMREGLLNVPNLLQTDTAIVLMIYGELKVKGWDDDKIIEEIAKKFLPIGFDKEYWQKKVKEILKTHGITIKKAMDTGTTG
ncbi:unnamed protein product, partial [marine sediment metagenome]